MTILYIDTEHEQVHQDGERSRDHQAKVEEVVSRLSTAAEEPCISMRFQDVSPGAIEEIGPAALVLSGSTTDWELYKMAELEGLLDFIRTGSMPILGICAGHQLIGLAHGAGWGPLGTLEEGETDPDPRFAPGQRKERGFLPVEIDAGCPLFRGLDDSSSFFQSHYWQLTDVPTGFVGRARSAWSPIQAVERRDRPVFGVQFHPERFDPAHPAGDVVLRNFFALARSR